MNYKCTLNVTKVFLLFPRYASTSEENRRIPKIYTKTGDKGYLILYYSIYMLICAGTLWQPIYWDFEMINIIYLQKNWKLCYWVLELHVKLIVLGLCKHWLVFNVSPH